jgi:type IV pilus assembly protein PilM
VQLTAKRKATVVGLDVEAGSVAAAEISHNGRPRLGRTGIAPLAPGVTREGEISDPEALGTVLKELFTQQKLPKEVRVGVANQRVVVRTLRMPLIEDRSELETAIRFQAVDHVPMPIEQAVLDWQVVAQGVGEGGRQMDVVVVAARRDMVAALVESLRHGGLKPVGIDLAAFGMIRALARELPVAADGATEPTEPLTELTEPLTEPMAGSAADAADAAGTQGFTPAQLYCNLGDITNLAVAKGSSCLFTRVSPFGIEGIAQRLAERRGLTLEHARQWLSHTGLERPVEAIEGDPEIVAASREALAEGTAKLADELRLSLEFYGAQEGAVNVEEIVACGPGTTIEGLVDRLQRELGRPFRVGRPSALSHLDDTAAARLTLSYGLGLDE